MICRYCKHEITDEEFDKIWETEIEFKDFYGMSDGGLEEIYKFNCPHCDSRLFYKKQYKFVREFCD